MTLSFKTYNTENPFDTACSQIDIVDFLFTHLDQYGDKKADISACIDFVMRKNGGLGGFVLAGFAPDSTLSGVVVINHTGMSGYIPENILVYIAVHNGHRGKGIGKQLMQATINQAQGSIALHVEPDNPARFLYEKLGFASKYLEMRLAR